MNYPKISIITPTLNQDKFIEQTILSVINQNYPNLEYIIIDGGSSDNTLEIIKKYEKHITFWCSEPDRGHSHAINKGLKHCTGDIFNWLNSDDYYENGALMAVANAFENNKDALIVAGNERAFNSQTNHTIIENQSTEINHPLEQLIYNGIICQPPTFYKKKVIDELGPLPEKLHYTMDSFWYTKFLIHFGKQNIIKIPNLITHFRIHENSKSTKYQLHFDNERFSIRLKLAQELNMPTFITSYFKNKTSLKLENNILLENSPLATKPETITAEFCKFIYVRYYLKSYYEGCKPAFKYYMKFGNPEWNWKLLIDYVKIIIVPVFILNFLRTIKKISD